jgi:hypothetical protein
MNESAGALAPQQAEEAVKAYIRLHRKRLADDGELLAMLLPERFAHGEIRDLQRHLIEKLRAENAALKSKLEAVERAVQAWGNRPTN